MVFGQVGRTLVAPYTVTDVDGGLLVRIGNVNLTINTVYEAATQARGIKFSWEADQYTRLEDCIDFGEHNNLIFRHLYFLRAAVYIDRLIDFFPSKI